MESPPNPLEPAVPAVAEPSPQDELRRTRERLGFLQEVAGVVSHDLKNPLSAVLLGVQRLGQLTDAARRPQASALVARLEATMQGMNQLLEGLADLSRLDSSVVPLDRRPVQISDVLRRAVAPLGAVAGERRQRIDLGLSPELPAVVECDAERMVQALSHLLSHAVRHSPEGATIQLTAAGEPGGLVLSVSDPGPVIPPGALAQLLAPEPRPSGPVLRHQHLGLLIARCLVEAHGGRLEIDCVADRGSTFRVRLPISAP